MNTHNNNRNIDSKKLLRCECSCLYFPATFVADIGKIGLPTLSGLLSSYNDCLRGLQTFSLSFVKSHSFFCFCILALYVSISYAKTRIVRNITKRSS